MPLSAFVIIVACLCGSMKELHNISDVKEVLFSTTLELLVGTNQTCQVKLCLLHEILLH